MKKKLLSIVIINSVLLLTGCSLPKEKFVEIQSKSTDQLNSQQDQLRESITMSEQNRIKSQDVDMPYLVGNSKPLAREVTLPDMLRKNAPITALFQRTPVDLQTALHQLSQATSLSITASPDALLPASNFGLKNALEQKSNPLNPPLRINLQPQNKPIWSVLDDIARQASLSWRPVSSGAEFYRLETRIFHLNSIPQSASTSASLGRNGGSNTVFESQSKTSFESKDQNFIRGMISTIDALLSQGGKATLSQENQTIVVTDTKDALERIDQYIKDQNKSMSRRVRVLIEAVEIVDKDASDLGVDWNVLYTTASESIAINAIGSLVSAQAGGFKVGRTQNGSSGLLRALNEVGVVVNRRSFPFLTTSGRPVTQALRSTFNYVDQVQASSVASSSTVSAAAPTVVQKEETVGTFVTLVPTAKSDGTIFLSVSFDVTSAQPLVPFTVGSSGSSITVQQKTIDGTGIIQEVPIRSGQTVIIGGIETQTAQSTVRRLGTDAPMILGGSDSNKITKTRMILLATAVIEEGI